jgi:hypothetical protein
LFEQAHQVGAVDVEARGEGLSGGGSVVAQHREDDEVPGPSSPTSAPATARSSPR